MQSHHGTIIAYSFAKEFPRTVMDVQRLANDITRSERAATRQGCLRSALVFLAITLALANPWLCILHCHLALHTTAHSNGAALPNDGFFCNLQKAHAAQPNATTAPSHGLEPRATYELTSAATDLVNVIVLSFTFLLTVRRLVRPRLAVPPPLPPPRFI